MSKGPGLFSDFAKNTKDLLNKDYSSDQKITVSTSSAAGVVRSPIFTINISIPKLIALVLIDITSNVLKKGSLNFGDLTTRYKSKNATVDVKLDTDANIITTLSVSDFPASTKTIASIKLPDYKSGKIEVQYFHQHASFTAGVSLNESPAVDFSATLGTPVIAFGAEASYVTATGHFVKYNAGVNVTNPDSSASVILADKGDSIRASYLRYLNQLNGGAVVGEISRRFSNNENTLTVGCSYVVDPQTLVKAKLNNHGNLGALLQHEFRPKSVITISGAFETKALHKTPKFGLALSVKP